MVKKAVVVHAEARDRYQVALALHEKGLLAALITDYYSNDLLSRLLPGISGKRYCKGLSSAATRSSYEALMLSLKMRVKPAYELNFKKDLVLSKKAFSTSASLHAHLFCYSYYAHYAFKQTQPESGIKKLLFQLHPHPYAVKELLQQELQNVPHARGSLMYENELKYPEQYLANLSEESVMADAIVVASNYTKTTLVESGVEQSKIDVVPYGIDFNQFTRRQALPSHTHLRIIYVGSMVQRKGLSYLLDAVKGFPPGQVELVLCGRGYIDKTLLDHYSGVKFTVKPALSQAELLNEFHQSDVFCLPSLCEGFAHVILEAMATGLPVISTHNTCAPDIMEDHKHGFIVPIRNSLALAEKIEWCIRNKAQLFDMGQAAALKVRDYTWQAFRAGIARFYEKSINPWRDSCPGNRMPT
jgi:glycosyltransferase involved in cell wall biosynthesis